MSTRKILFLATEDWFIRSHFLPILRQARADGLEVVVAARKSLDAAALDHVRVIHIPFGRGSFNIGGLVGTAREVRRVIEAEKPDFIYSIALQAIVVAIMSVGAAPRARWAFALTGRGFLGAANTTHSRVMTGALARLLRGRLSARDTLLLVENEHDRAWVEAGKKLPDERVILLPGAGIDPEALRPAPLPTAPPLRVGLVSRLVYSKGVDLAVEAVKALRASGVDMELHIAGAADPHNPGCYDEATLAQWRATPGVTLHGHVTAIADFWAGMHVALLPSRGGEGLPRSLLEAAACGRAIVTTAVPGCQDFVRDGQEGLLTPTNDAAPLIQALRRLAEDPALRDRLGANARARVAAHYTIGHVATAAAQVWRT